MKNYPGSVLSENHAGSTAERSRLDVSRSHQLFNHSAAIIVLLIVSSSPFIPSDCKANSSLEEIEAARTLLFACQTSHVRDIDDKQEDARAVALNLTNLCLDAYQALNRTAARYNYDNSNERRMFTTEQNSKMLKIEASLPVVNLHRQEKK